jgi:hypothetical protein
MDVIGGPSVQLNKFSIMKRHSLLVTKGAYALHLPLIPADLSRRLCPTDPAALTASFAGCQPVAALL